MDIFTFFKLLFAERKVQLAVYKLIINFSRCLIFKWWYNLEANITINLSSKKCNTARLLVTPDMDNCAFCICTIL